MVVPCLNEVAHIERLLSGLASEGGPLREVILVDGGSTDGTPQAIERWKVDHPGTAVSVLQDPGLSIPRALNMGIRNATGGIIVRLDAHCRPFPGYLAASASGLKLPNAGVVGGRWQIAPGGEGVLARAIALAVADPFGAGDARYRNSAPPEAPLDVDTVPFGCFTKRLWTQLGGFDERLLTNEDYEFNYRARKAGLRVILHPQIRSEYFARPDLARLAGQYLRYGWWKAEMLRLHPGSLRWRQAVPAAFSGALVTSGLAALAVPSWGWAFAAVASLYLAAAFLASARICAPRRTWAMLVVLPVVFASLHISWGLGILANILNLGLGQRASSAFRPPQADEAASGGTPGPPAARSDATRHP